MKLKKTEYNKGVLKDSNNNSKSTRQINYDFLVSNTLRPNNKPDVNQKERKWFCGLLNMGKSRAKNSSNEREYSLNNHITNIQNKGSFRNQILSIKNIQLSTKSAKYLSTKGTPRKLQLNLNLKIPTKQYNNNNDEVNNNLSTKTSKYFSTLHNNNNQGNYQVQGTCPNANRNTFTNVNKINSINTINSIGSIGSVNTINTINFNDKITLNYEEIILDKDNEINKLKKQIKALENLVQYYQKKGGVTIIEPVNLSGNFEHTLSCKNVFSEGNLSTFKNKCNISNNIGLNPSKSLSGKLGANINDLKIHIYKSNSTTYNRVSGMTSLTSIGNSGIKEANNIPIVKHPGNKCLDLLTLASPKLNKFLSPKYSSFSEERENRKSEKNYLSNNYMGQILLNNNIETPGNLSGNNSNKNITNNPSNYLYLSNNNSGRKGNNLSSKMFINGEISEASELKTKVDNYYSIPESPNHFSSAISKGPKVKSLIYNKPNNKKSIDTEMGNKDYNDLTESGEFISCRELKNKFNKIQKRCTNILEKYNDILSDK